MFHSYEHSRYASQCVLIGAGIRTLSCACMNASARTLSCACMNASTRALSCTCMNASARALSCACMNASARALSCACMNASARTLSCACMNASTRASPHTRRLLPYVNLQYYSIQRLFGNILGFNLMYPLIDIGVHRCGNSELFSHPDHSSCEHLDL